MNTNHYTILGGHNFIIAFREFEVNSPQFYVISELMEFVLFHIQDLKLYYI